MKVLMLLFILNQAEIKKNLDKKAQIFGLKTSTSEFQLVIGVCV